MEKEKSPSSFLGGCGAGIGCVIGAIVIIIILVAAILVSIAGSDEKAQEEVSNKQSSTYSNQETAQKEEISQGKVEVKSHTSKKDDYGKVTVTGEVINNTAKPVSSVKVTVTFYNSQDQVVGTDYTYPVGFGDPELQPNTTAPFEITKYDIEFATYKLDVSWD